MMASVFTKFPDLPGELQLEIWEAVLDGRLARRVELEKVTFWLDGNRRCCRLVASATHKAYNTMLTTCHDARKIALQQGTVVKSATKERPSAAPAYIHHERDVTVRPRIMAWEFFYFPKLRADVEALWRVRHIAVREYVYAHRFAGTSPRPRDELEIEMTTLLQMHSGMKSLFVVFRLDETEWGCRYCRARRRGRCWRCEGERKSFRRIKGAFEAARATMASRSVELKRATSEADLPIPQRAGCSYE